MPGDALYDHAWGAVPQLGMSMLRRRIERHEGFLAYHDVVAASRCRQITAEFLAEEFAADRSVTKVVDLGCGDGRSLDLFRRILPGSDWEGIDIEDSPEAQSRRRADGHFAVFNGTALPYPENSVDLVFSKQVLHHVEHPGVLVRDVARVLKPGGVLIGSTSALETYQSRSLRSYTPYGLKRLFHESEFERVALYPGVDGLLLFCYHLFHEPKWFHWFFNRVSPLNASVEMIGWMFGLDHIHRNFVKIQFAGHVGFIAYKPLGTPAT